jgi:hypothetical protein
LSCCYVRPPATMKHGGIRQEFEGAAGLGGRHH